MLMEDIFNWLIESSPWIEYRARLDLLLFEAGSSEARKAKKILVSDQDLNILLQELLQWPGEVLKNHKAAGHPLHKLTFIADVGFQISDSIIGNIVDRVMAHKDVDGPFQVLMNIHPRYGGSGTDEWSWALCDAPLLLYALAKFGLKDDSRVIDAIAHLAHLVQDNGWLCETSKELGKFRGPGRKDDPCPYATLVMLKALAQFNEMLGSNASQKGVESILALWEERRERHPYMFYMGTDFSKIKAPLVWYDILHVSEVLSHFPWVREDRRFIEMLDLIYSKADVDGRYTPESIWTAWKGWDFGQKKAPSPWLTFLIHRLRSRLN
jgi:hypothetical protein